MKKIILLTFILTLFISKTFSQSVWPCSPDVNLTYNGISPESLPPAMAGYEYWSTLSFKIPKDSAISVGASTIAITIDSARFLYATGKPAGFTFYCNTPTCTWAGGTKGCALFNGRVDSTFTGDSAKIEYPMKVYTLTWYRFTGGADQFSRIDSATNYVFKIFKFNGISELSTYQNLTAYPNPTTGKVNIELRDLEKNNSEVKIMDAFGKLIYQTTVSENNQFLNTLSVDLSEYKTGMYFITVKSGDKIGLTKVLLN
jgi:hypothetical protein